MIYLSKGGGVPIRTIRGSAPALIACLSQKASQLLSISTGYRKNVVVVGGHVVAVGGHLGF